MSFFSELKRRNVFKVGVAYAVACWLLLQIVDLVLENINAPDWIMQVFMLGLAVGFPIAIIVAWAFEMTPEGVKLQKNIDPSESINRHTGQQLNRGIIMILSMAIVFLLTDRYRDELFGAPEASDVKTEETAITAVNPDAVDAEKSIAVLPFIAMSDGPDDEYFADGLTEEILNSLAQLPELLITARTSSFHFKGQDVPVQEIAAALGVEHIVEGSVRRSGERLRVTAQLIRSEDGFHLWSENYDSTSADSLQVQEDIAEKIAEAMNVVMDETRREAMRKSGLRNAEAFVNYQKAIELFNEAHDDVDMIEYLRRANQQFDKVIAQVPDFAPAYIHHTDLYVHILMNQSVGRPVNGVTGQDISDAQDILMTDLALAAEHARNSSERYNIELDQAYLSGNWRGMKQKLERSLAESGCRQAAWVEGIAAIYGLSDRYALRAREIRECDPMRSRSWFDESRAFKWAGDAAEALKIAREGSEVAPGNSLSLGLIHALVANGLYEETDSAITTHLQSKEDVLRSRILKSAAMGDRELATRLQQELMQEPGTDIFWKPAYYAWTGEREKINRHAAELDSQPFGPQSLLLVTLLCSCGAPWDIETTPNFAARVKEAGMPWPPASPIHFPLKDW